MDSRQSRHPYLLLHRGALGCLIAVAICLYAAATPLRAQDASLPALTNAPDESALEEWLLVGVDATLATRSRLTAGGGWVGGFDSWIVLTEGSYIVSAPLQLLAGYVYLRPHHRDAANVSIFRGGLNWSALRGRVRLDNRLLVERRSIGGVHSPRVRDRLRLSWAIADGSSVRLFTAFEAFAVGRDGLSERRYQAGLTAPIGRASIETYCLRSAARTRAPFDALGLTLLWRIGGL